MKREEQLAVADRFQANLVRHRKLAGLSQDQVGIRAGLHRTEIGDLERGARLPRIDTLIKVAGALGVEPGELVSGVVWKSAKRKPGDFKVTPSARKTEPGRDGG